jgi:hypothetical protein
LIAHEHNKQGEKPSIVTNIASNKRKIGLFTRSTQESIAGALNAIGSNFLTLYNDNEKGYAYANLEDTNYQNAFFAI